MQRSLYDQSCHLPDFLAPTSCQFTHSIAVCFFNLVCGWFLFFLWVFTLRFLKKLQDLVYTAVEISCCVALCTIDAILCLTFAQHVLPTHLVTNSPVSGWFPVPMSDSTRSESLNQLILMSGTELDWSTKAKMWNSASRPRPFKGAAAPDWYFCISASEHRRDLFLGSIEAECPCLY